MTIGKQYADGKFRRHSEKKRKKKEKILQHIIVNQKNNTKIMHFSYYATEPIRINI